jgi:hypothetical protein
MLIYFHSFVGKIFESSQRVKGDSEQEVLQIRKGDEFL